MSARAAERPSVSPQYDRGDATRDTTMNAEGSFATGRLASSTRQHSAGSGSDGFAFDGVETAVAIVSRWSGPVLFVVALGGLATVLI